jgi:hypothetical protein
MSIHGVAGVAAEAPRRRAAIDVLAATTGDLFPGLPRRDAALKADLPSARHPAKNLCRIQAPVQVVSPRQVAGPLGRQNAKLTLSHPNLGLQALRDT